MADSSSVDAPAGAKEGSHNQQQQQRSQRSDRGARHHRATNNNGAPPHHHHRSNSNTGGNNGDSMPYQMPPSPVGPYGMYGMNPAFYAMRCYSVPVRAPAYELKWSNLAGDVDTLNDWYGVSFGHETYGNFASFIESISPTVPVAEVETPRPVPSTLTSPASASHRASPTPGGAATGDEGSAPPQPPHVEAQYLLSNLWSAFAIPFGQEIRLAFDVRLSPLKSIDRKVYYTPMMSAFHFYPRPNAKHSDGSPVKDMRWVSPDKPENRKPLRDQVNDLTSLPEYEKLTIACNTDFTVGSWFAVLWNPIHVRNHTAVHSAGSFLCFYAINPPRLMPGSDFTGVEAHMRSDALSVPLPIWRLAPETSTVVRIPSRAATPAATPPLSPSHTPPSLPMTPADVIPPMPGEELQRNLRIPIFAVVPCHFRTDVWFQHATGAGANHCSHSAPLHLFAAAVQLMRHEEDHGGRLPDAHHMTKHERYMQDFIRLYSGM